MYLNSLIGRFLQRNVGALALCLGAASLSPAMAVTVSEASPRGEVSEIRQIRVHFSEAVVPLGDLRHADPFTVRCEGDAPKGAGRWADGDSWVYDFHRDLSAGTRCTVTPVPTWKPKLSAAGTLQAQAFQFSTGGPAVRWVSPSEGSDIEETSHFLLRLTGAVDPVSLVAKTRCEAEGVGERIPVVLERGKAFEDVVKARKLSKEDVARSVMVRCQRPLPAGAHVKLVVGAGVASQSVPGLVSRQAKVMSFDVRRAFVAEFRCERERAQSPCMPLRPMTIKFSSPVSRKVAEDIRLKPDSGSNLKPSFDDDKSETVDSLEFKGPLPESMTFKITLPSGFTDESGRELANASAFPLKVATSGMPPLAKFAAAPFGVIELESDPGQPPLVPITVRNVEKALKAKGLDTSLGVRTQTVGTDADILRWMAKVRSHHETSFTAKELGRPRSEWREWVTVSDGEGGTNRYERDRLIGSRELSLLSHVKKATQLEVPAASADDPRPFEVVGIPMSGPGYHVIEVSSARLGKSLLAKDAPMYVRTGVLVTNMGVHFKLARNGASVWVTSLDKGKPVTGADVTINDCRGQTLWRGKTNKDGLARVQDSLVVPRDNACLVSDGLFVTARKVIEQGAHKGKTDVAFVFSDWQRGIEAWRFQHPTSSPEEGADSVNVRTHTVTDRSLFRAGETVSMKHFIRQELVSGLGAVRREQLPHTLKITHEGSGTEYTQHLNWAPTQQALSNWVIPKEAKLGVYEVSLEGPGPGGNTTLSSGRFRVEEYRLPLVDARLSGPKQVPFGATELALSAQLRYLSGGAMAGAPARVTAVLRDRTPTFKGYEDFSFSSPQDDNAHASSPYDDDMDEGGESSEAEDARSKVVADKVAFTTDGDGIGKVNLKDLPARPGPSMLQAEMTFTDPNGEVQTVGANVPLWPSGVVVGIRRADWAGTAGSTRFQVIVLDTRGKPVRDQSVSVRARLHQTFSSRKRIVGGFYAYDNRNEVKDLGSVCKGSTDSQGMLSCEAELDEPGEVELVAEAKDTDKRVSQAATTVWITRQGELWFMQDNDDRMDVFPEKTQYEPGETARLQVRMPFREATVLVSIEREGIIEQRVMALSGKDPVIELPIPKAKANDKGQLQSWAPNVYVSVMALRGRVHDVPWYSFFTWGWRSPIEWAKAFWYAGREYQAPTAMVDLSRPAYKVGVAALRIGTADHQLSVEVKADQGQYAVRQNAKVHVRVTQDGKPVQGDFAFAAVDEALLALSGNPSWNLLDAMLQERAWGVETSTAQNEIVGRRHYGRKAVAAGGGGGGGGTRELFDTLLLWQGSVQLNANGEATLNVPLNDSLTSFRLVAVAGSGLSRFGTGSATIRVTQDLQMLSGLPPLVREGDRFEAIFTLRNTTAQALRVQANLAGQGVGEGAEQALSLKLPAQTVELAPDSAQEVRWSVDVPAGVTALNWEASAVASGKSNVADRVKLNQQVMPAVPVRVMQATLSQLQGAYNVSVAPPADGLVDARQGLQVARGGVQVGLQSTLTANLPGLRRYFQTYPYVCLEQKVAKAIGLHDPTLWADISAQLPSYLDEDGLASYFPPMAGAASHGTDYLTAHILAIADESGFALPAQAKEAMLQGLDAYVQGRLTRSVWSPSQRSGLMNDVRRLAAIEALSRYGRADGRMLDTVTIAPQQWPTAAVINWFNILQRVSNVPAREQRLAEVEQILRSRLTFAGTTLRFSTEADDFWWWLMDSPDANAARLVLAVMNRPNWQADVPRLVVGALGRQRQGAWLSTHANLWAAVALNKFAQHFEKTPVTGVTQAKLASQTASLDWAQAPQGRVLSLPWPGRAAGSAPAPAPLHIQHDGAGAPWLTVQTLAAVPLKAPLRAGYAVTKTVKVQEEGMAKATGKGHARGTILKVRLEINAQSDMTWVVVNDPVPGGATILGSGLGRDSALATAQTSSDGSWPVFVERAFDGYRAYFDYLPKGEHVIEYTVRLNNPGRFQLPPTRVEAMYAPETFGELPNAVIEVSP